MTVEKSMVFDAFRALLGRLPEDSASISAHCQAASLAELLTAVTGSLEYQLRTRPGPLWNYTASFDPIPLILSFENGDRVPVPGHRTNYLGVAVNVRKFFPELNIEEGLEPIPIPANWHTDIAELAAVLRSVENAGDEFSMIELGCGWGCWMNISGAAARMRGKAINLMGVEGDEGHVAFAREAMATNRFREEQYKIFRGVAGAQGGKVFFPRQDQSGGNWGLEPIFNPGPQEEVEMRSSDKFEELDIITLAEITAGRDRIDLLHIDIQGGEVALVRDALTFLNEKVAYIVVGTHSRAIDGALIEMLTADGGWVLEIERPTVFSVAGQDLITRIDGVQGWKNSRF